MEKLINKRADSYEYLSRYSGVSYYYDTSIGRDVFGVCRQIDFNTPYISHKLKQEDSLDSLALKYYNNPTFWWAIAYFNKINDPFINLKSRYSVIKIPAITGVKFKD